MKSERTPGFTLAELLIVIAVISIIAAAAFTLLSSGDSKRLDVAAEETANVLRFALGEALRTGGYVLVDGKSTAGQLALYNSNANAQTPPVAGTSAINDPLTKRAAILDISGSPFSQNVTLTAQFRAGGSAWTQLLIGPGLTQMQVFDGASTNKGPLQANSGVRLGYGGQSVSVAINEATGLVTLP
jgi:prepilin-type N-terminal cleavage/methylation domain-containing protein